MAEEKKNKDDQDLKSQEEDLKEEIEEEIEEIEAEAVDEDGNPESEQSPDQDNEYLEKYQRLLADFNNYKRREDKAKADFKAYASGSLIEKLLPVLDNFDRALKDSDEEDPFVKGVIMTRNELWKVLENEGLKEIPSDNEKFDPNFHQAFMTEKSDEVETDHIIETYQKGYMLKDRVLRPSMVKVSK